MNTDKATPQEISEDDLFTPEGDLTPLAHEELHKHITENYGRVKILSKESSVVDVLSENLDPDESQK